MIAPSPAPIGLRLTFLELFTKYDYVEIPLIQRDYAQGRESAKGVRLRFVSSLLSALNTDDPLNLDFVYGEVVKDRCFQPIDGQQRLTTLFLLHWFLACAAHRLSGFRKAMRDPTGKARFCYSVRPSSDRFFAKLLDYAPGDINKAVAKDMKDQHWFFQAWLHDPTIVGALTMIDDIRVEFAKYKDISEKFYEKLERPHSAAITLDVLDLGSLNLSEAIYIKMNARGKELTGFEKFKAWLIETHQEFIWPVEGSMLEQWQLLLDGAWLDLFWHFRPTGQNPADSVSKVYFRTCVALAVNFHELQGSLKSEGSSDWLIADRDDQEATWKSLFTSECLVDVFQSLLSLSVRDSNGNWAVVSLRHRLQAGNAGHFGPDPLDEPFFEGTAKEVSLDQRLWLHAICVFFRNQMPVGGSEEIHWFRIVRNLLANTEIDAKSFDNAIQSLDKLGGLAAKHTALKALEEGVSLGGINARQLKEEQCKASLIALPQIGGEWELLIKEAEAHAILRGQIELLLPEDYDFSMFKNRWAVFRQLFDKEGNSIGREEHLVARAVLAHCDSIQVSSQRRISFLDTPGNWSRFWDRIRGNSDFRKGLPRLIAFLVGRSDIEAALRASQSLRREQSWMNDLIRYGQELFSFSGGAENVTNYYDNGVFLFRNEIRLSEWGDIMLGPIAALRSRIIERLLERPAAGWTFPSGQEEWRVLRVDGAVFFKGHVLRLVRRDKDGGGMYCQFGYKDLKVGDLSNSEYPPVTIVYPEDGNVDSLLHSLRTTLAQEANQFREVLDEVMDECRALVDHSAEIGEGT